MERAGMVRKFERRAAGTEQIKASKQGVRGVVSRQGVRLSAQRVGCGWVRGGEEGACGGPGSTSGCLALDALRG